MDSVQCTLAATCYTEQKMAVERGARLMKVDCVWLAYRQRDSG